MFEWLTERVHLFQPFAWQIVLFASTVLSLMMWFGVVACVVALVAELALSSEAPPERSSTS